MGSDYISSKIFVLLTSNFQRIFSNISTFNIYIYLFFNAALQALYVSGESNISIYLLKKRIIIIIIYPHHTKSNVLFIIKCIGNCSLFKPMFALDCCY